MKKLYDKIISNITPNLGIKNRYSNITAQNMITKSNMILL